MAYFTEPENVDSLLDLIYHVNDITGGSGLFGMLILVTVFSVSFISGGMNASSENFGYSSFFTFIAAIFLRMIGLVNDVTFYMVVMTFAGTAVYFYLKNK